MSTRRRRTQFVALLLATFSVIVACSDDITNAPSTPAGDAERIGSGKVGVAGGAVSSTDGTTARVEIPAGALKDENEITIAKVSDVAAPKVAGSVSAGTTIELGPEGIAFAQPVRVIIAFDPTKRPAGAAQLPTIFSAAKGAPASAFVAMPTVAVDSTHVATTTTHFSWWTPAFVVGAAVDAGDEVDARADLDGALTSDASLSDASVSDASVSDASSTDASIADAGADADSSTGPGPCVPLTCAMQGSECGYQGDGCGNAIDCGACPSPQICGGGGVPSKCGGGDGGSTCVAKSCAAQGVECGAVGDGCGGLLSCGSCSASKVCRGAPGQCVQP